MSLMAFMRRGREVMLGSFFSFPFMTAHRFLMGLRFGESPGQSMTSMLFYLKKVITLLLWQGAPSHRNLVAPNLVIQERNLSHSISRYRSPLMVTFGGKEIQRASSPNAAEITADHHAGGMFEVHRHILLLGPVDACDSELARTWVNQLESSFVRKHDSFPVLLCPVEVFFTGQPLLNHGGGKEGFFGGGAGQDL